MSKAIFFDKSNNYSQIIRMDLENNTVSFMITGSVVDGNTSKILQNAIISMKSN